MKQFWTEKECVTGRLRMFDADDESRVPDKKKLVVKQANALSVLTPLGWEHPAGCYNCKNPRALEAPLIGVELQARHQLEPAYSDISGRHEKFEHVAGTLYFNRDCVALYHPRHNFFSGES